MFRKNKSEVSDKKKLRNKTVFDTNPDFKNVKPLNKYIFHSDYFEVDDGYACVLGFFHIDGARDDFGCFWGINRIPSGLDSDVSIVAFEQIRRMTEGWLSEHQTRAEGIAQINENEQNRAGSNTSRGKARRTDEDLSTIAQELQDGASYLNVHYRLLVKAPTLDKLDKALLAIDRLYIDRFATLSVAPYLGEQRRELSNLFAKNDKKLGSGYYFTSTEYAGSYSLVTHGLEDATGEYVGFMIGDVNNSAVVFDVNKYNHHIVIANENYNEKLGRVFVSDMWGSKVSQSCLFNSGRVVHIILDTCDLDKLGPKFKNLTYRLDMNNGDVNMFEMFGDVKDELAIFAMQMQKLVLMAEQAYETTDNDRSIIRGSLEEVATSFYINRKMWYENAAYNRHRLRVTGIEHKQVPKLEEFVTHLDTYYKSLINAESKDPEKLHAAAVLNTTFRNMLSNNGDLFNTITSDKIDGVKSGRRTIYDFSGLMHRGKGIAMAQLVNVIGYAVGNLGKGDTVIIHGAEYIDEGVRNYINLQFDKLYLNGGRVCYLYNSMDKMVSDVDFNHFDKSDYTVLGCMSDTTVKTYQRVLGQDIPADLERLITTRNPLVSYIRRGFDNIVFQQDLLLGLSGKGLKK